MAGGYLGRGGQRRGGETVLHDLSAGGAGLAGGDQLPGLAAVKRQRESGLCTPGRSASFGICK